MYYAILSFVLLQLNGATIVKQPKNVVRNFTITCTMTLSVPPTGNPTTTNAVCTAVPK